MSSNYLWRQVASGVAFLGAGVVLPLASLYALFVMVCFRDRDYVRRQIRHSYSLSARLLFWWLQLTKCMSLTVEGIEKLNDQSACLVIANHPTFIDFLAILSLVPDLDCIVKANLKGNFLIAYLIKGADYICNDSERALIDTCVQRLLNGRSLIVFPEGTRSEAGVLGRFQRGAATIALAADCEILPIFISCDPPSLQKGQAWYQVPARAFELKLVVGDAFRSREVLPEIENSGLGRRKLTEFFEAFFQKRMSSESDSGVGNGRAAA